MTERDTGDNTSAVRSRVLQLALILAAQRRGGQRASDAHRLAEALTRCEYAACHQCPERAEVDEIAKTVSVEAEYRPLESAMTSTISSPTATAATIQNTRPICVRSGQAALARHARRGPRWRGRRSTVSPRRQQFHDFTARFLGVMSRPAGDFVLRAAAAEAIARLHVYRADQDAGDLIAAIKGFRC